MTDALLDQVWPELLRRGIVAPVAPKRLGVGNSDRRSDHLKAIYQITIQQGATAKLTVGTHLDDLVDRAHAWANTFPELSCRPIEHLRFSGCSAFVETFFDGIPLDEAVRSQRIPFPVVHCALGKTIRLLSHTREPSSESARADEWQSWVRTVQALPLWTDAEAAFLRTQLLPALGERLLRGPAQIQWVHGDLIDRNFLLSSGRDPCLIDPEFAQRTHFFPAEAARFHALSAAFSEQPGLFIALWPETDSEWQLFFWLNQIVREASGNTASYVTRWLPHRLATIRALSDKLFGNSFWNWPWQVDAESHQPARDTAQLFWSDAEGWSEKNSVRIPYREAQPQTLWFPISGKTECDWLRLDPVASPSPRILQRLAYHSETYTPLRVLDGRRLHELDLRPLGDTHLRFVPNGLALSSASRDPQIALPLDAQTATAKWLEVQLGPTAGPVTPTVEFRLEGAQWVTQPSTAALRITGWCVSLNDSDLLRIEAESDGRLVATSAMLPRPDVQAHHGGVESALRSGFALDVNVPHPRAFLEFFAVGSDGRRSSFHVVQAGEYPDAGPMLGNYPSWAKIYDSDPAPALASSAIRFSVILPVFDAPEEFLRECIDSVRQQHHTNWELCIVDDASVSRSIVTFLEAAAGSDKRIRLKLLPANGGIARASNSALSMASGDYVVMLDHDDLLRPHALSELAHAISSDPTLDALYSDEDKITSEGRRVIPFLKPAFSPEFLLAVMYPGHVLCVRTSLARTLGGFDSAFNGVQDYEFFLRVTERTRKIGHVPRILYHWRQSPKSSALEGNVKGDMDRKQLAAVRAHLERMQDPREVTSLGRHRLKITARENPRRTSIVLGWPMQPIGATECDWTNLLHDAETVYALPSVAVPALQSKVIRLASADWTQALAEVAKLASSDVLVLFTEPPLALSHGWLTELASLASRPDAGCVAPLLLSREGPVFESGLTISADGSRALMRGFDASRDGYNGALLCNREVAAVSPLCVAVRRELIAASATSEENDWIHFCVSLNARGFFNRVCAHVRVGLPLSWRKPIHAPAALGHGAVDPFFNAHFDHEAANYSVSEPPAHLPQAGGSFIWHLDTSPPRRLVDGCLTLRGWCFRSDGRQVTVEIEVAGMAWCVACHQHRPDVAQLHHGLSGKTSGFTIDLRLPTGRHTLTLRALAGAGVKEVLIHQPIDVPYSAALRRWSSPDKGNRAAFQFMASPSQRAKQLVTEIYPRTNRAAQRRPFFSIVTPSFQQARFLRETLQSVICQQSVEYEYIVQDGGSTDGSVELIQEEASHLAFWESAQDGGQADAIVRGFAKSRGGPNDVMAWINSDDFYLPGAFAYVADFFAAHPKVDVIYGNRIVIDDQSREIGRWFLPPHEDEVLKLNDYIPQETIFWRRRIWDKVGGIDPSFNFAMDWDLLLRFQAAGAKIVRVPYFLACFRVHSAQKTSAQMESVGQKEIDALRFRSFGRVISPIEIETHPRLLRYVRKSASIEFLWRWLRIRHL